LPTLFKIPIAPLSFPRQNETVQSTASFMFSNPFAFVTDIFIFFSIYVLAKAASHFLGKTLCERRKISQKASKENKACAF
jgi:hypothetical protein